MEARGRFFTKEFPELSRGTEGRGDWDQDRLSSHTQLSPEPALRFTSPQGPSPTLGPGAIPQLLPEASVETEEEMGEGRPRLKFSPLPLLIGHHLPAPAPQSSRGWGPACGRERKGRWRVSWSSRGRGWPQLSPPTPSPQPWRQEEETRRVLKAPFCEWDERGRGKGGVGAPSTSNCAPRPHQRARTHTHSHTHTHLESGPHTRTHTNSQPYLLHNSALTTHLPKEQVLECELTAPPQNTPLNTPQLLAQEWASHPHAAPWLIPQLLKMQNSRPGSSHCVSV